MLKVFWALDASLAHRRHFPAINWLISYSLYLDQIAEWMHANLANDWVEIRNKAMDILQQEEKLKEIVMLVGPEALPEREKMVLEVARMIREDFLQQNAFDPVDTYSSLKKQYLMLKAIMYFYEMAQFCIKEGIPASAIKEHGSKKKIAEMKFKKEEEIEEFVKEVMAEIERMPKDLR